MPLTKDVYDLCMYISNFDRLDSIRFSTFAIFVAIFRWLLLLHSIHITFLFIFILNSHSHFHVFMLCLGVCVVFASSTCRSFVTNANVEVFMIFGSLLLLLLHNKFIFFLRCGKSNFVARWRSLYGAYK